MTDAWQALVSADDHGEPVCAIHPVLSAQRRFHLSLRTVDQKSPFFEEPCFFYSLEGKEH
jgi:hypothetical protein